MTPDRDTIFIQPDPIDDAQVANIKSEYPAGLRSESLAGFELECMADFIGIRRNNYRTLEAMPGETVVALRMRAAEILAERGRRECPGGRESSQA